MNEYEEEIKQSSDDVESKINLFQEAVREFGGKNSTV
jgi:hypothetical protein